MLSTSKNIALVIGLWSTPLCFTGCREEVKTETRAVPISELDREREKVKRWDEIDQKDDSKHTSSLERLDQLLLRAPHLSWIETEGHSPRIIKFTARMDDIVIEVYRSPGRAGRQLEQYSLVAFEAAGDEKKSWLLLANSPHAQKIFKDVAEAKGK